MKDHDPRVDLLLYVSPQSMACARAARVMREILLRYDTADVSFTVRDLTHDPDEATNNRIVFTPTLLKRLPQPNVWIRGDLSKPDIVVDLLHTCGITPKIKEP